jgi:hypothetical protein
LELFNLISKLSVNFQQLSDLSYSCDRTATLEGLVVPKGPGASAIYKLKANLVKEGWDISRADVISIEATKGSVNLAATDLPTYFGRFDGQAQIELKNGFAKGSLDKFVVSAVSVAFEQSGT